MTIYTISMVYIYCIVEFRAASRSDTLTEEAILPIPSSARSRRTLPTTPQPGSHSRSPQPPSHDKSQSPRQKSSLSRPSSHRSHRPSSQTQRSHTSTSQSQQGRLSSARASASRRADLSYGHDGADTPDSDMWQESDRTTTPRIDSALGEERPASRAIGDVANVLVTKIIEKQFQRLTGM